MRVRWRTSCSVQPPGRCSRSILSNDSRQDLRHSAPIFLDRSDTLASKESKSSVASNSGMKNLDAASAMRSSVVRFDM